MEPTETMNIAKWKNNTWQVEKDLVVREDVVTVYLNDCQLVRLHCSPDYLDELAVGYLKASGWIKQRADITHLTLASDDKAVHVKIAGSYGIPSVHTADTITTGCGQGPTFYHCWQNGPNLPPVTSTVKFCPEELLALIRKLHQRSELFKLTGGVHSAALGDAQGLTVFRQDIGRHNAVDKVIGHSILQGINMNDRVLVVSGRISSDIIFKAALSGLPVVVSPSAPTALAVKLARHLGLTVVGFARGTRLSVYSEVWRLQ